MRERVARLQGPPLCLLAVASGPSPAAAEAAETGDSGRRGGVGGGLGEVRGRDVLAVLAERRLSGSKRGLPPSSPPLALAAASPAAASASPAEARRKRRLPSDVDAAILQSFLSRDSVSGISTSAARGVDDGAGGRSGGGGLLARVAEELEEERRASGRLLEMLEQTVGTGAPRGIKRRAV